MFPWDDLRVFLATCRTGSHAGAARALQVAPTTVGRRLAALEEAVGARLFARTPEGLAPTAAVRALLPRAERMEAETNEAERALSGADARAVGVVRLTCGEGFAEYVLAPALPAFLAVHPGLTLEVRPRLRPARHADVVPGPRPAVPRVAFRANTTTLVHAACAAGAGVALLSCAFVEGDPRFARVLPRVAGPALKLWSVAHADLRASARVEVTLRFLEALVRRPGFELG